MKEQIYFEHADARFGGDLIVSVLDDEGRSGIFSTNLGINNLQNHWYGGVPVITLDTVVDVNDLKLKRMDLVIDLIGVKPSKIRNIQVLGSFDYMLQDMLKIEMKGMMHVDLDTPNGLSKAFTQGELLFD